MPKRENDIFSLYDPLIEVGESLKVNVNKRPMVTFTLCGGVISKTGSSSPFSGQIQE